MRRLAVLGLLLFTATPAMAEDWPQWMGVRRDGVWNETGLLQTFPAGGPKVLWKAPVQLGYSGPAVANGKVYVADYAKKTGSTENNPGARNRLEGSERLHCLDAATGKPIWMHEYNCVYQISYPSGPRATPTVAGDHVYFLGAEGDLTCLQTANGSVVWQRSLAKEYKVESPIWGFCGSPLVVENRLYVLVGGEGSAVVCLDAKTGKEIWKALSAPHAGYAPPSLITAGGVSQLLVWHPEAMSALHPETGAVYWTIPLKPDYGMSIMAPQRSGDYLFASGIGDVGALVQLSSDKPGASVVWRGTNKNCVYAANTTPLISEGILYGADCKSGGLRAVKLETGERLWEDFQPTTGTRRGGHGTCFLVKNGDRYILFSETGDLIFAALTAKGYEELSRAHVIEPTGECFGRTVVWSHPAFANKCVFVRNDQELVCVSLADAP